MSGHRKFSELTKNFSPEQKRRIKMEAAKMLADMERERHSEILIPPIALEWSQWHSWGDVERDARDGGAAVPNGQPGVYEVMLDDGRKNLLAIGRATDLRMQIKQGLVRGELPHSAGSKIRADIKERKICDSDIGIRWAVTDRPAAVEEELHRRHRGRFGEMPRYTKST